VATINVIAKITPLGFLLYLFPPRVEIDGGPAQKIKWSQNSIQVPPGQHRVAVYFPYMWVIRRAGEAAVDVNVAEGQTATVRYRAPWLVFLTGKISAE
jgi:hypothetical protein